MRARPDTRRTEQGSGASRTAEPSAEPARPRGDAPADERSEAATRQRPDARVDRIQGAILSRQGILYSLKIFLAVRLALAVVALIAVALLPDLSDVDDRALGLPPVPEPVDVPGWDAPEVTPGWHNLVTAWERFDALWYLRIASDGYENGDGSAAFFPLYPLVVRAVSFVLGGHPLAASLLVSNLAFLAALVVLYELTRREMSEDAARRATVYAAIFPTAFFFLAPYGESLFLLLVVTTFWAARSGRFALAAVLAALAALTRSIGLLLVLPIAVEAVRQARAERRSALPALAWAAAPAAGTLLYMGFWYLFAGDWLAPLNQQANWLRQAANPLLTLVNGTVEAFRWIGVYPGGYHLLDWLITVPVLAAGGYLLFRARASYSVYVWGSLIVPLSFVFTGRPLMSLPRFALPIFPLYWALAAWTAGRPARHQLVIAVSAGLLGLATALFVTWYYVF